MCVGARFKVQTPHPGSRSTRHLYRPDQEASIYNQASKKQLGSAFLIFTEFTQLIEYAVHMASSTTPARRIAFITGSAQGIGRAIALRLAEDGYDVALNDIPKFRSELYEVAELIKINTKSQAKTYIHIADVTIQDEINAAIDGVVENLGGLDVVRICLFFLFKHTGYLLTRFTSSRWWPMQGSVLSSHS